MTGTLEEAKWIKAHELSKTTKRTYTLKVVPNGISYRAESFWENQEFWPNDFLFVGGFTWKKNGEYAISILQSIRKYLPEAKIYIVGCGEDGNRFKEPGIEIIPSENPDTMETWYKKCPYLISASRYEGGRSFAILEAQSFGMVAFATAIPSTRECISDMKDGILLSGCDIQTDSNRVLETVGNDTLKKAIGLQAYKRSVRNRWERQFDRLDRIIRS